jgi:hypothetical protein
MNQNDRVTFNMQTGELIDNPPEPHIMTDDEAKVIFDGDLHKICKLAVFINTMRVMDFDFDSDDDNDDIREWGQYILETINPLERALGFVPYVMPSGEKWDGPLVEILPNLYGFLPNPHFGALMSRRGNSLTIEGWTYDFLDAGAPYANKCTAMLKMLKSIYDKAITD